jgi:Flp pilus assembly protein TadG
MQNPNLPNVARKVPWHSSPQGGAVYVIGDFDHSRLAGIWDLGSGISRRQGGGRAPQRRRLGAILSLELILVLPILTIILLAIIELSFLMMGLQRVQSASSAACRVGTLPPSNSPALDQAMQQAAIGALDRLPMIAAYQMTYDVGQYPGDPVWVQVTVPMTAATPDLLRVVGLGLKGRQLTAQTVMRKQ